MNILLFSAILLLTFALTAVILRFLIPVLKSHKMGQKILDIGPRWHKSKEGTPTMGGVSFVLASLIVFPAFFIPSISNIEGSALRTGGLFLIRLGS